MGLDISDYAFTYMQRSSAFPPKIFILTKNTSKVLMRLRAIEAIRWASHICPTLPIEFKHEKNILIRFRAYLLPR